MAELSTGSAVRGSQHPADAQPAFPSPEWRTFLRRVKAQDR
ncbi:DUF397 domain-containing protein [Nocardiopsis alborubida]|nr:DUF397 domain-containing protein [Nocardiopsis alborubida]